MMKKTYNKSLCVRGKYKNEYHKNIDRSMIYWGITQDEYDKKAVELKKNNID